MAVYCGIDLGTTYSSVCWFDSYNNRVEPIGLGDIAKGANTVRSVVYYPGAGNPPIIGEPAWDAARQSPERVIVGIKRSMGPAYKTLPIDGRAYTPQEVSAEILKAIVKDAGIYLGEIVKDAVITVPPYFDVNECVATEEAGRLAGLNVLGLLLEPHAVALAFAIEKVIDLSNRHILVYQLGGGTFGITLMHVGMITNALNINTLYQDSNTHLGGLDWDKALADIVAEKVLQKEGVDVRLDPKNQGVLLDNCEKAKRSLSRTGSVIITADLAGHRAEVTTAEFEDRTHDLLRYTQAQLEQVLAEAENRYGLTRDKVDVMLAGGSSEMPMVKKMVAAVMGQPPLQHRNPELLTAIGAAYWAYLLQDAGAHIRVQAVGKYTEVEIVSRNIVQSADKTIAASSKVEMISASSNLTSKVVADGVGRKFAEARPVEEVIKMFAEFGLLVCDDGDIITQKFEEKRPYYVSMLGKPDPAMQAKGKEGVKSAEALLNRRSELLRIVYDHFAGLADITLVSMLNQGQNTLSKELVDHLRNGLALKACRADEPLADRFVADYLRERGLKVGNMLIQPAVVENFTATGEVGGIKLNWTLPKANCDEIEIVRETDLPDGQRQVVTIYHGYSEMAFEDADVNPGVHYTYRAHAVFRKLRGADSVVWAACSAKEAQQAGKISRTTQKSVARDFQTVFKKFRRVADEAMERLVVGEGSISAAELEDELRWLAEVECQIDTTQIDRFMFDYLRLWSRPIPRKYDVFLSYRRKTGESHARLFYRELQLEGLRPFMDVMDLHTPENYKERIHATINAAPNFIIVLTPDALEFCGEQNDWLRQEIELAYTHNRTIIPVSMHNFNFPAELPPSIAPIRWVQSVNYSDDYYRAVIEKIVYCCWLGICVERMRGARVL